LGGQANMGSVPVQIYNCGDQPLTLGAIPPLTQTSGPAPNALSISGVPASGTMIAPQNCTPAPDPQHPGATFSVDFHSSTFGIYMGMVTIPSDDPIRPSVQMNITASHNM